MTRTHLMLLQAQAIDHAVNGRDFLLPLVGDVDVRRRAREAAVRTYFVPAHREAVRELGCECGFCRSV